LAYRSIRFRRQGQSRLAPLTREHLIGLHASSAAVIHYKPLKGECETIASDKIYLCDSGAQYLDGTTDTTRTLHFGTPTEAEKEAYTLVLKGNIALDTAIFPKGTTGLAVDGFARQFLWVRIPCSWRPYPFVG
jgi:Xaa-Pro aminopeptidase